MQNDGKAWFDGPLFIFCTVFMLCKVIKIKLCTERHFLVLDVEDYFLIKKNIIFIPHLNYKSIE